MSYNIADNDDDLFDYDPDVETPSSQETFSSSDAPTSQIFNDLKEAASTFDFDTNKPRLALAFSSAIERFLEPCAEESYKKATEIVLDQLTGNQFSLLKTFYELEMKISRKMMFLHMFGGAFKKEDFEDDNIRSLFKFLNIEVTSSYIRSSFESFIHITNHSLILDRHLYSEMSTLLDIQTKDFLFDNPIDMDLSAHTVYFSHYRSEVDENIYRSLATPDFLQTLSNLYECPVNFVKNEK